MLAVLVMASSYPSSASSLTRTIPTDLLPPRRLILDLRLGLRLDLRLGLRLELRVGLRLELRLELRKILLFICSKWRLKFPIQPRMDEIIGVTAQTLWLQKLIFCLCMQNASMSLPSQKPRSSGRHALQRDESVYEYRMTSDCDSLVNKSIKRESIRPWGSEVLHVSFRVTGGWVLAPGEKSFLKALSVVTTIR